jgi:hypothetical protein
VRTVTSGQLGDIVRLRPCSSSEPFAGREQDRHVPVTPASAPPLHGGLPDGAAPIPPGSSDSARTRQRPPSPGDDGRCMWCGVLLGGAPPTAGEDEPAAELTSLELIGLAGRDRQGEVQPGGVAALPARVVPTRPCRRKSTPQLPCGTVRVNAEPNCWGRVRPPGRRRRARGRCWTWRSLPRPRGREHAGTVLRGARELAEVRPDRAGLAGPEVRASERPDHAAGGTACRATRRERVGRHVTRS